MKICLEFYKKRKGLSFKADFSFFLSKSFPSSAKSNMLETRDEDLFKVLQIKGCNLNFFLHFSSLDFSHINMLGKKDEDLFRILQIKKYNF